MTEEHISWSIVWDLQWFLVFNLTCLRWNDLQQPATARQRNSVTRTDCNFTRVAMCYNNCFTFIKEREKFILHFTKYDMFNGTWSWLLIDELGLSSRVRDMSKFCWEGTFIKLPVIVSVATNIHHFLCTLLSFHKRLLNCGQQANTARRQANTSTLSQIYPSIAPRWSKREPFSILHVRGVMLRCFSSS